MSAVSGVYLQVVLTTLATAIEPLISIPLLNKPTTTSTYAWQTEMRANLAVFTTTGWGW